MEALSRPELAPVWARIRTHLERYGWASLGVVSLDLDSRQALALGGIVGSSRLRAGRSQMDLGRLDQSLRESRLRIGLIEALEQMGGALVDRRQARQRATAEEQQLWERLTVKAAQEKPELIPWLAAIRRRGTAKRAAGKQMEMVLANVIKTCAKLPSSDLPLQVLAVEVGSAHDLDWNQPLGSMALSALAFLAGQAPPTSALGRRRLWASFGVVLDTVSATVLTLNLRPLPGGLASQILLACALEGEPASLTLGQLLLAQIRFAPEHDPVLVCENPAVVENLKSRLGTGAPAMVCTSGRPNTAVSELLEALGRSGVKLLYHGDFDYAGIAIANEVIARFGAKPWNYDTNAYLRALEFNPGHAPEGRTVEASWDPALATTIAQHNRAIHEEALIQDLLSDLSPQSAARSGNAGGRGDLLR